MSDTGRGGGAAARMRVVIVGCGFAGLALAKGLGRSPVDVCIVDRRNHHAFQPLLYQVATASLSAPDIAWPIRKVLSRQANARVLLAEAVSIDAERRLVVLRDGEVAYDVLCLCTGVSHSYFGHPEWDEFAPGLKTVEDALRIRQRFLLAFEAAERESDAATRRRRLTFVVVGGGPTGVELAGAMAEMARRSIPADFRAIDTTSARIVLVQGADRVLEAFPAELSERARRDLERLGVEVRLNSIVTGVDERGVSIGAERIEAGCVLWAAGVAAEPLARSLGCELDRSGRVVVNPDLSVPGHPEVLVLGDLAAVNDPESGKAVPGVAPAATQMGRYAAKVIDARSRAVAAGQPPAPAKPFRYVDKGILATIGRARAVADLRGLKLAGLLAWLLWAGVHVLFLIEFRNRLIVMIHWAWAYVLFQSGARLITGDADLNLRGRGRAGGAVEGAAGARESAGA